MALNFRPLADRVLIRRMREREETYTGIYIPEFWREKEQFYIVEAVGPGKMFNHGVTRSQIADAISSTVAVRDYGVVLERLEQLGIVYGKRIPVSVSVGDAVLMGRYSGTDVKIDGVDYSIVRDEEILAVVPRVRAA